MKKFLLAGDDTTRSPVTCSRLGESGSEGDDCQLSRGIRTRQQLFHTFECWVFDRILAATFALQNRKRLDDHVKLRKPNRSFFRLLLEYLSVAGSVFFVITLVMNGNWKQAIAMIASVTGQAVCVAFGAFAIICLWLAGKLRSDGDE